MRGGPPGRRLADPRQPPLPSANGEVVYNTCPVINPDGEVVARYRKIYPFYPYEAGVAGGAISS